VQVRNQYRQVPYHNFFHCVDVTHATFRFIRLAGGRARMTPTEKLSLMIAALCHDMDHPGTSPAPTLHMSFTLLCPFIDPC
jgi:hypothetical protein